MKINFILVLLVHIQVYALSQTKTTYKNKSGNPIGYSKTEGNKTIYYDKSHNKTGSAKSNHNEIIYYNKKGNKVGTSKTK